MQNSDIIRFGPFNLDPVNESLSRGSKRIHLRPKAFALIRYLASRPGQLATKDQLMNSIWQDCNVGEEALKHCVKEIRKALKDRAVTSKYIETVHCRGYRFIAKTARNP